MLLFNESKDYFFSIGGLTAFFIILLLLYKNRVLKSVIKELRKDIEVDNEINEINKYRETTNNIYDNVLEADITNNYLLGENSQTLIGALGLPNTATFTDCIDAVLINIVKEEFRDRYKEAFSCEKLLERYHNGEKMFSFEFIEKADLVTEYWTKATVCIYYSKATNAIRIISYIKNIQQEKDEQLRFKELAYTDALTKVLNIGGFINGFENNFSSTETEGVLFIIDIDRFKQINDVFGHQKGDSVLINVAMNLKNIFNNDDIIGRLGGDEFVVLVHHEINNKELKIIAQRICDSLRKSYIEEDLSVDISASVGIAIAPAHGNCFDTLYKNADSALYRAKNHGKNQYAIFE